MNLRRSATALGTRSNAMHAARIAFAALVAALGAWLIGSLPVDVALDLDAPVAGDVAVRWRGGASALREVSREFAPHHFEVRVTAPEAAEGRTESGLQMVAMAGLDRGEFSPEQAWVNVSTYFLLHGAERPAQLILEGWNLGPEPYLSFETDSQSGTVTVSSRADAPVALDLHSGQRGQVVYPIQCDGRLYRFYGRLPRKALNTLTFDLPDDEGRSVCRLFVNALVPRVFYAERAPSGRPAGIIREEWAPAWHADGFALPGTFYLGASFWTTFAVLLAASVIAFSAAPTIVRQGLVLLRAAWAARPNPEAIAPFRLRLFLAFWVPLVVAWGVFLLAFYPGTMNLDSLKQWQQAQTGTYEHGHPPFYAMVMWAASRLWNSPSSVALLQIVAGASVLAYGISLLWRAGVPKWVVAGVYILTLVSMRNATMMVALVKDTPFGICMLAGAILLASTLLHRWSRRGWIYWAAAGVALGLMSLFRYNGPHVLAALIPLLVLVSLKRVRGWAVCTAAILLIHIGVTHALFTGLGVARGEFGIQSLLTSHLAILIDRDVPMRNEEYGFLKNVRTLSDRWAYHERRADSTALPFLDVYDGEWAGAHLGEYAKVYGRLVARNPLLASRYFWDRGSYLYVPWPTDIDMEKSFLGITPNDQGLANMQFFVELPDALRGYLRWTESPLANWLFWRPAIPLYLVLAACAILCVRARDISWAVVYAPFIINTAILTLCAISHNARYQYPLTLSAGFLVALAFLPGRVLHVPAPTSSVDEGAEGNGEEEGAQKLAQTPSERSTGYLTSNSFATLPNWSGFLG